MSLQEEDINLLGWSHLREGYVFVPGPYSVLLADSDAVVLLWGTVERGAMFSVWLL